MIPAVVAALAKAAPYAISMGKKVFDVIKSKNTTQGVAALTKAAPALKEAVQGASSIGSTQQMGQLGSAALDNAQNVASGGFLSKVGNGIKDALMGKIVDLAKAGSTNDPEWFGEFKSAGATMNELIATDETGNYGWAPDGMLSQTDRQVIQTNVSNIVCGISFPCGKTSAQAKSNLLPTLLADVRKASNNVLADDTNQYWETVRDFVYAYEVYYSGMKLLEYSENLPINIPAANAIFPAIAPKNISQFRGMIESLGHYLKTTVRLPYALTAYIRWRFGTMFLTDDSKNTAMSSYSPQVIEWRYKDVTPIFEGEGKNERLWTLSDDDELEFHRGFIVVDGTIEDNYNMSVGYNLETAPIEAWVSSIMRVQRRIAGRGRAPADIRLAYQGHAVDYSVEPRHYDAKEANVRCNSAYYGPFENGLSFHDWNEATPVAHNAVVVMNSALPMSEGIQSMCLSSVFQGYNSNDFTFFPIMGEVLVTPFNVACSADALSNGGGCVEQVINGETLRSIVTPSSGSGPVGGAIQGRSAVITGGFDSLHFFGCAINDLDRCEFIALGGGGTEMYTYVKTTRDNMIMKQLDGANNNSGENVIVSCTQSFEDVGFNGWMFDGRYYSSLMAPVTTIPAGWHMIHCKSNYRDVTQAYQSPKFGYVEFMHKYVDGELRMGSGNSSIQRSQYGFYLAGNPRYLLCYEAAAQERVSIFDGQVHPTAEVAPTDQEFGNLISVNKNSSIHYRQQALMNLIGTHLANDYAKQLEVFHPGAGQMYSTYKSAVDDQNGVIFLTGLQSYDYATITSEQVGAVHRTAHRNLIRDSLKQKAGAGSTQEAKDLVKGTIDMAVGG